MNQDLIRNNINDSTDDNLVLQYLKDFTAQKCLYCFQDDKKFLCKCSECDKYFCNNIHRKSSHIIIHLKQCKHKKISLNPFDEELACENCRKKDIFELYFKDKKILCEECIKDQEEEDFNPIVDGKKINEEILMSPDVPPLANRFDSYTESLITRINHKILRQKELGNETTVSINYSNKKNYCLRYINLLEKEKDEVVEENEGEDFFEFDLKFSKEDGYVTAEIKRNKKKLFLFYERQFLIVAKNTNRKKTELAKVINIDKKTDIVTIYFKDLKNTLYDGPYLIKEKESTESISRMINGLEKLKKENSNLFNKNILDLIIANEPEQKENNKFSNENEYLKKEELPSKLNIPKFEDSQLNKSQEEAIQNCFKNKLTLIRGPPGTGKTKVLATLAYHLLKLKNNNNDKIFIGAPSNRAVDNISYYLQKLELPFIRVISLDKELSEDVDKTNSLDDLVMKEIEKDFDIKFNSKQFKELRKKRETFGKLHKDDFVKYREITKKYEEKILLPCPIILATINNSADKRIEDYDFPIVLIDEATQALEPDCLLPIYHKAEMVVMIGDEMQLGPTVKSEVAEISGLGISLFERLCFYYKGSNFISSLNEQYRMHSSLYEFSNKKFYGNKMLTHGEIELDEKVKNQFPWANKEIPTTLFWHCVEKEKSENYSFYNEQEMDNVYDIVKKLQGLGVKMKEMGVITPYKAQKLKLQFEIFKKKEFNDLKIESVDGFQGMEKDYIIISTVRSNKFGKIGFLRSHKRLNVSLTRARKGVIIIGDAECLSKRNGIWRDLIEFYLSKKLIVQGDDLHSLELPGKDDLIMEEIDEEEEIKEDDVNDFYCAPIEDLLNLNQKTSSELAWGMSQSFGGEEEKEEDEGKNEIIGLDIKNKKKKNKKKNKEEKETDKGEEDEKEEKDNKKKKNNEEDSDSEDNNKGKKKKKRRGKK